MKSIIFIAPPAAGKGTQSEMVSEKYNMPHISTGDLLRSASKEDNELGRYISEQMQSGGLVSDDITLSLLEKRIQLPDCNNGYILDGFPRNVEQAKIYDKILEKLNKKIGVVILLEVDYNTAMKRSCGRLNCLKCGRIYNYLIDNMKPLKDGLCDDCYETLNKREDDNEETFKQRFNTYLEATQPVIDFYKNKNVLYVVDGSDKDIAFKNIVEILEK